MRGPRRTRTTRTRLRTRTGLAPAPIPQVRAAAPGAPAPVAAAWVRCGHGVLRVRGMRVALALVGGVLWWLAVLRFGLRPDTSGSPAGGLHAAIVAAGWSLGLIPMHAVPAGRRGAARRRRTKATAAVVAGDGFPGDQPFAEEDAGS